MKRINIELDRVPTINDIAKEWETVYACSPKVMKQNNDIDYYGGLILANTLLKGKKAGIREEKFDTVSEEDYAIPGMADAISKRQVCVFEILADDPDETVELEVFLIFSEDNKCIERILCLNLIHLAFNWVANISGVIEFLDVSASLHLIEEYQINDDI